jgi:hypothetical protein
VNGRCRFDHAQAISSISRLVTPARPPPPAARPVHSVAVAYRHIAMWLALPL